MQSNITAPEGAPSRTASPGFVARWRVVDIIVASVIGVAAGVIYWAYGLAWENLSTGLGLVLPGSTALIAAVWLFAGVLGGLVIRKPGAALYTETIAAVVSALIGTQWGLLTIESGLVQGLGAELVLAIFLYRRWGWPVAMLAGAGAGLAMAINDLVLWYPGYQTAFQLVYVVAAVIGGALIAGLLSWFLARALAATGALNRFAAGREVAREV